MPIYEYRCNGCERRVSLLVRGFTDPLSKACPRCGSPELDRLVSRVAVLKSEESRMEELADPSSFGDVDENDPQSMARWMKRMGSQMGEDMGPEFDEMVDKIEAGEMPDGMGDDGDTDFGDDDVD